MIYWHIGELDISEYLFVQKLIQNKYSIWIVISHHQLLEDAYILEVHQKFIYQFNQLLLSLKSFKMILH